MPMALKPTSEDETSFSLWPLFKRMTALLRRKPFAQRSVQGASLELKMLPECCQQWRWSEVPGSRISVSET
jgi:hypothetical protein